MGFHPSVLEALKEKASNMSNVEKRVIMSFDEMTLSASLKYDSHADQIEGFEDYGGGIRSSALADHSSVFMCRGLKRNWKQPFGYFLPNGCIPGEIPIFIITHHCCMQAQVIHYSSIVTHHCCMQAQAIHYIHRHSSLLYTDSSNSLYASLLITCMHVRVIHYIHHYSSLLYAGSSY